MSWLRNTQLEQSVVAYSEMLLHFDTVIKRTEEKLEESDTKLKENSETTKLFELYEEKEKREILKDKLAKINTKRQKLIEMNETAILIGTYRQKLLSLDYDSFSRIFLSKLPKEKRDSFFTIKDLPEHLQNRKYLHQLMTGIQFYDRATNSICILLSSFSDHLISTYALPQAPLTTFPIKNNSIGGEFYYYIFNDEIKIGRQQTNY